MRNTFLASVAVASLGGSVLLAPSAAFATQSSETNEAPTAVMGPAEEYHHGLTVNGVSPTLRSVVVDGESILAYCIEYWVQAADPDHESAVTGWDEFTGDNYFKTDPQVREHVAWILRNSHPTLSLEQLATTTGTTDLTEAEAIAATQAAIWHFTDDFVADGNLVVEPAAQSSTPVSQQAAKNVQTLFDYFTGTENTGLTEQQVQASATLVDATGDEVEIPEPIDEIADEDDHVFGPVLLDASADQVDLDISATGPDASVEELSILDATGSTIDVAEPVNADEIWVHVPAETETGGVEITAESTEFGYTGRLITPEPDEQRRFQTIVMVDETTHQASTSIELDWQQPQHEEPPAPSTPPEPSEPPTEEPPSEEPPSEEPRTEEPPVEQTPPPEAPVEEPTPAEPQPERTDGPIDQTEEQPVEDEAEPVQMAGKLAETGAHQTRNVLIALGTLAVGGTLLVINRFVRKRS